MITVKVTIKTDKYFGQSFELVKFQATDKHILLCLSCLNVERFYFLHEVEINDFQTTIQAVYDTHNFNGDGKNAELLSNLKEYARLKGIKYTLVYNCPA